MQTCCVLINAVLHQWGNRAEFTCTSYTSFTVVAYRTCRYSVKSLTKVSNDHGCVYFIILEYNHHGQQVIISLEQVAFMQMGDNHR